MKVAELVVAEDKKKMKEKSDDGGSGRGLENWHSYLDFVEMQGDFDSAVKLYERCLIPRANYPEFWMRYVDFMEINGGREIANYALDRATQIFLKLPQCSFQRLSFALFSFLGLPVEFKHEVPSSDLPVGQPLTYTQRNLYFILLEVSQIRDLWNWELGI
ncbi:hypothetical protein ACFX1T_039133 [Malus domestica]